MKHTLILLTALLLGPLAGLTAAETAKPNIIFILTDDQRFDAMNAACDPEIKTPAMDQLAAEGTQFVQATFMGGNTAAGCLPSSASKLLWGRPTLSRNRDASLMVYPMK